MPMPLLELRGIAKRFGVIEALAGVEFVIESGEIIDLMDDNGAGKSTLVRAIAGNFPPSSGELLIEGKPVHFAGRSQARQHGIEAVYQDLALSDNLTASANVFLACESQLRFGPLALLRDRVMYSRAGVLFKELRSKIQSRDFVRQMSGGQRQAVAVARTCLAKAKIPLMDEPTAAISGRSAGVMSTAGGDR